MNFKKDELIKSPLNYTGGKYKLLPKILPYIPDDINIFVDLFAGGCNVGINVKAKKVVFNDIETHVINLMKYFKNNNKEDIFNKIENIIEKFNLSDSTKKSYKEYKCNSSDGLGKYNKEAYLKLREYYNNDTVKDSSVFYVLSCYSFSNQIRFNSKGGFNMPYGKRDFNKNMRNNLNKFIDKLSNKHYFHNKDFRKFQFDKLRKNDFVYIDPPYLITCATYNESDGWNQQLDIELMNICDDLNSRGIRFAMSNVFKNKGKENKPLQEWSKKYDVKHLSNTYGNCNYHASDKSLDTTDEVLIINY